MKKMQKKRLLVREPSGLVYKAGVKQCIKKIKAKVFEQGYFLLEKRLEQQDSTVKTKNHKRRNKDGNDEEDRGYET